MINKNAEIIEKLQAELDQHEENLDRLKIQDSKLDGNIRQLKEAMDRKIRGASNPAKIQQTALSPADEQRIERQLEKQLENARAKLKQYQNELKLETKRLSAKSQNTLEDLFSLEEAVKQKDIEIKQLNEEIKELTNLKRKQEKVLQNKQKGDDAGRVSKLADEIRALKEVLTGMQANYSKKKEGLTRKQKQVEELEAKYFALCEKNGEKPITFEQFKERRREKKKEEELISKPPPKKQYMSIRDIINAKDSYDNIEPTQENLQELRSKREIAENALKNARKKYEKQIDELSKKLAFLNEENVILENRLKEKQKEKQLAEAKYAETSKKNTVRRLTPLKPG